MRKRPDPVCNDPIFQRMESNSQWKTCKDLQGKRNVYGDRNEKGTQSVKLDYETPGLKIGACISLGAWIGLGIYGLYFEKYRKKLLNQC